MKNDLTIYMVLISSIIGGAEKRYTNLFNYLVKNGKHSYKLIINRTLYELLLASGVKFADPQRIILVGNKISKFDNKSKGFINRFFLKGLHSLQWRRDQALIKKQAFTAIKADQPDIIHGILKGVNIVDQIEHHHVVKVASYVHPENEIPEYQREALGRVDALDILDDNMKSCLINAGIKNDHMYVTPCSFTDYSRTKVAPKKKQVIFMARLEPMKHPQIFIEMLSFIPKEELHSAKFIMMGTGSLRQTIEDLAQPYIKAGVLDLKGYVPNPIDHLAESLIFVQPTDCEAHGTQSLLEAMACGNAIVTTNLPGVERIVTDAVGFRVEHAPQCFAEKVTYLLKNFDKAVAMGASARQRATTTQTIESYGDYIEKLYTDVYDTKRLVKKS